MHWHVVQNIATAALTVVAAIALARQCRKPTSWLGRLLLWTMNASHTGVTRWGLQHVVIEKQFTMLDVGCGGGRTVHTLADLASDGKVYGLDYAAQSVAASLRTNRALIAAGRVDIRQGTVSRLPYADGMFDIVTAIETHYYWPDPEADVREIRRVLKPGGRLVVVAETYRGRQFDFIFLPAMKFLRATYLTLGQHRELLTAAGYSEVEVFEERAKGWICCVARSTPS